MVEVENMTERELVQHFRKMSDLELHSSAVRTAEKERKITLVLLRHLNEIERRRVYSKFNSSSLHAYCVKELKMDDGVAGRRVSAARLLKELPVIEEKILSGAISLTAVAQTGIFFRKEERIGNSFSTDEKKTLVLELENKSTREVDLYLLSKSDQPEIHFQEKITPKTETVTEVKIHLDHETMAAIERLKEIWSHSNPHSTLADTIKRAAKEAVEKHDPLIKAERAQVKANLPQETATSAQKCDRPKAEVKRAVWLRDGGRCTFCDPRTGERCGSKHFLEEDHIEPKALGGEYSTENIRLRCRAHNQRHAINTYGLGKMEQYLRP